MNISSDIQNIEVTKLGDWLHFVGGCDEKERIEDDPHVSGQVTLKVGRQNCREAELRGEQV